MSNLKLYKAVCKLESADILALGSGFNTIVPSRGLGTFIIPIGSPVIHFIDTGANYTGGSTIALRYSGASNNIYKIPAGAITGGGDRVSVFTIETGTLDSVPNSGIDIFCTGTAFSSGVGHAYIIFQYTIGEYVLS